MINNVSTYSLYFKIIVYYLLAAGTEYLSFNFFLEKGRDVNFGQGNSVTYGEKLHKWLVLNCCRCHCLLLIQGTCILNRYISILPISQQAKLNINIMKHQIYYKKKLNFIYWSPIKQKFPNEFEQFALRKKKYN